MTEFFRWQWMWRSRSRLLGIAAGAIVFGMLLITTAWIRPGPLTKARILEIAGGLFFVASGSYQVLQGVLSPSSAFGNLNDYPEINRHQLRRQLRRAAAKREPKPVPHEEDDPST